MGIFGNNYKAGTLETDQDAPWNQVDPPDVDLKDPVAGEDETCPMCGSVAFWEPGYTGWVCGGCEWGQKDEDTPT